MATKEELYLKFGPMLIEAIVLIVKEEINILRVEAGLSERTDKQILTAIDNKLSSLPLYDWINNEIGE